MAEVGLPKEDYLEACGDGSLSVAVTLVAVAGAVVADRGGTAGSPLLIGANYTNWGTHNCDRTDTGVIAHYDAADAGRKVRAKLAAMHADGLPDTETPHDPDHLLGLVEAAIARRPPSTAETHPDTGYAGES